LEGDTLDKLVMRGDDAKATALTAQVANAVTTTDFRFPFIYKRVVPSLQRDFRSYLAPTDASQLHPDLARAATLLANLTRTTKQERVIHGDLGFGNIMLTPTGPRLIDPKGLRADPAFDLAKTLVAPYAGTSLAVFEERIAQRGPILAQAVGASPLRLTQWATVILAHKIAFRDKMQPEESNLGPYLTRLLDLSQH
ncbi:MAG: aminoglycoside phosphotransferase family protein, partial [Pseudomonadota bacterium]